MKAKPLLCPPAGSTDKLDLFRLHKADYVAPRTPALIVPAAGKYLTVTGHGAPGGAVFQSRIGALYGIAFTIKMTRKSSGLRDYAVAKLEARYLGMDFNQPTLPPMEEWTWQLLIRTPDFIVAGELRKALVALRKRGKEGDGALVRLERIKEGECVQVLHVGPYDREGETCEVMRAFAKAQGRVLVGPHHEIYLSDPRRVAAERLRTILRIPVARA